MGIHHPNEHSYTVPRYQLGSLGELRSAFVYTPLGTLMQSSGSFREC